MTDTNFFPETDISITNAQCPPSHVEANWHKTIWCRKKGTYPLLVIRRWIWHMWWKSLYKCMRLETVGERCHVENSWDTHHAITNVFPAHPSCMYVVRLRNDFYFWICPLTCTGACKRSEENCAAHNCLSIVSWEVNHVLILSVVKFKLFLFNPNFWERAAIMNCYKNFSCNCKIH